MNTFQLIILTPAGEAFNGQALQLSVRAVEGEMAVLAGHIPFVTALRDGACRVYMPDASVREAKVEGGLLSVGKDATRLLSSSFVWL